MTAWSDDERLWMKRAFALAVRSPRTHPNPRVGAVLVRDGVCVGEGWHCGIGTDHAEAMAFKAAGDLATGATLFVTLEPCSHPVRADGTLRIPCASRCMDAGVARVVVAMVDPDRQVAGRGLAQLRASGIEVDIGLYSDRVAALLRGYSHQRRTGYPLLTHKVAMTLDGKTAAVGGDSRWVTGASARRAVHRARRLADAVVVGVGTVLADDPALDVRLPGALPVHNPIPVVLDSALRIPASARVVRPGAVVATVAGVAGSAERNGLIERGVEIWELPPGGDGRVDLRSLRSAMASRGWCDVLLEAGGTLAEAFHAAGLIDRMWVFVAPKVIGGRAAPTPMDGCGLSGLIADAHRLTNVRVRRYGDDIAIEGDMVRSESDDLS